MEKAWQWWYNQKLTQLESEANLIRDQLLQESLAIRRSLELSLVQADKSNSSSSSHQKCVERLEQFSFTLKELSDRLYPPYLNEGLPFALQYSVERWQKQMPKCKFKLNLPQAWLHETSTDSSIVLSILEDLFRIQEAKTLSNNLIFIDLQQNLFGCRANNELKIIFEEKNDQATVRDNLAKHDAFSNKQELQYLQQIFESLTSGSCRNILTEDSNIWLFKW